LGGKVVGRLLLSLNDKTGRRPPQFAARGVAGGFRKDAALSFKFDDEVEL